MPEIAVGKSQPWKAYPPPPENKANGFVYPETKKGEMLVLDGRGAEVTLEPSESPLTERIEPSKSDEGN